MGGGGIPLKSWCPRLLLDLSVPLHQLWVKFSTNVYRDLPVHSMSFKQQGTMTQLIQLSIRDLVGL
jgi:hypothetical protein